MWFVIKFFIVRIKVIDTWIFRKELNGFDYRKQPYIICICVLSAPLLAHDISWKKTSSGI